MNTLSIRTMVVMIGLAFARFSQDLYFRVILVELTQLKLISSTGFLAQFRNGLNEVRSRLVFLPGGVGLLPTNDAFPVITRKGCSFEQLANYLDDELKIYVDREIFNMLSEVDQAAFLIHEAVYKIMRVQTGESSSVRSRKLTAQLLASNPDQGQIQSIINQIHEITTQGRFSDDCGSPKFVIDLHKWGNNGIRVYRRTMERNGKVLLELGYLCSQTIKKHSYKCSQYEYISEGHRADLSAEWMKDHIGVLEIMDQNTIELSGRDIMALTVSKCSKPMF